MNVTLLKFDFALGYISFCSVLFYVGKYIRLDDLVVFSSLCCANTKAFKIF
jgi:hypothetical protein